MSPVCLSLVELYFIDLEANEIRVKRNFAFRNFLIALLRRRRG